jgi:hypothetical protein
VNSGTECIVDNESYCTIATGNSYCTFDFPGEIPAPLPSDTNFRVELGPSAVTVSNDVPTYLVDDGSARCGAADAGCTAMGVPEYNLTRTEVQGFTENYYIDDPDTYGETLCKADALFCEEWSTPEDGNYYFKDPGKKTCEYQEGITLDGSSYSGWFRQGTNEPCYWDDSNGNNTFEILTDNAYLIGGSEFGVWNNGDDEYEGWTATCPASADQCTAFADPTDTQDGEMPNGTVYSFLNDEKMEESNLPEAERCDGSVSRKEGCVLFHNRNIPELRYSASASYMASKHADYLFGDTRFSRQDPISCEADRIVMDREVVNGRPVEKVNTAATWPDGEIVLPNNNNSSINLCAQRCVYQTSGDTTLEIPNTDVDVFQNQGGGALYATGSCVFDSDCSNYEGSDGDMYSGDCRQPAPQVSLFETENDTNQVVKVNRDRECAEWLACKSEVPAYDQRTGEWVNKCDAIGLCTDYNREGDSTRCTAWSESEEEVLTRARYANRDVSWTGLEYSGYSIPNQLPVDQLEEVDLKQEDADDPDVRLANVVGVCNSNELDRGETCAVGYCQDNSGISCNSDTNCPGSDVCVTSICKEPTSEPCSTNSDCDTQNGFTCNLGVGLCERVATDGGGDPVTCETGSDCNIGAGEECRLAERTKVGSCINNKCVQNIAGNRVSVASNDGGLQNVEDKACRGYPEAAAPYASDEDTGIVESWRYVVEGGNPNSIDDDSWANTASVDGVNTASAKPESLVQRYQNVNTCGLEAGGDPSDCVCSYEKIEYGGGDFGGTMTKYYELEAEIPQESICVGGEFAGRFCNGDDECGDNGECRTPDRRDTALGWEGFCLERDDSINLFNNTSKKPCLTWYPVDQLSGSTDLYAKYTEAGYEPQDTYYCSQVEGFYDLKTSGKNGGDGSSCTGSAVENQTDDKCIDHVVCPPGYFSIFSKDGCGNDCQFRCVPKLSRHSGLNLDGDPVNSDLVGQKCLTPTTQSVQGRPKADSYENREPQGRSSGASFFTDYGYLQDYYEFSGSNWDDAKEYYSDCVVRGLTESEVVDFVDTYPYDDFTNISPGSSTVNDCEARNGEQKPAYCNRYIPVEAYLGCSTLTQVSSDRLIDGRYNAAWTNRVWGQLDTLYSILTEPSKFQYQQDNYTPPFAISEDLTTFENKTADDPRPQRVAYCVDSNGRIVKGTDCPQNFSDSNESTPAYSYMDGEIKPASQTSNRCINKDANGVGVCERAPSPSDEEQCEYDYQCPEASGPLFTAIEKKGEAYQRLRQIFAGKVKEYKWNVEFLFSGVYQDADLGGRNSSELENQWTEQQDDRYGYTECPGEFCGVEVTNNAGERVEWNQTPIGDTDDDSFAEGVDPEVPQIWSVGSCEGTRCREGAEGSFSVDNKDEGNITGSEEKYVTLRFFAAANENQMPIRNIVADWGDGVGGVRPDTWGPDQWPSDPVGSMTNDNFYRNHRGYIGDTSQCEANNDTFAGSGRACDETYISLTNHYVCDEGLLNTYPSCQVDDETGKLLNAPCTGGDVAGAGGACVFQPRVSVKDNWGWCTGTCPGGVDETDECYDGNQFTGDNLNECNWDCPGGPTCQRGAAGSDPWIYYDGYIIIEP